MRKAPRIRRINQRGPRQSLCLNFFWRAPEDSKSLSQAHDVFITSQTRPVITQVVVQAQSTRSRSVVRSEISLDSEISPGLAFPVLVPQGQGQGQGRPAVVRHVDLDSLYDEEEFWLDLHNEDILRNSGQSC